MVGVDTKWWMAMVAALALGGCTAPANEQAEGASETSDPTDSAESESTGDLPDDGIDAHVECGNTKAIEVDAAELATNAEADAMVGLTLLGELSAQSDNVLLSPLSLRTAFGQVYAGTSGTSRTEIAKVFGFDALGDRTHAVLGGVSQTLESRNAAETEYEPELIFRPANRSFFDTAFEENVGAEWMETVQQSYGVCFEYFDMNRDLEATRKHINAWVSDQTNDMIPDLVKFLPEHVSLVLVNALYFRASWGTPFEDSLTAPGQFTARSGDAVEVDMMRAPLLYAAHAEGEGWEAVAIPYSDSRLELVVVMPDLGTDAAFEAGLDGAALDGIFQALAPTIVDLTLPKFDIKSSWALRSSLEALGMQSSFANGGDFSGIAKGMEPIFEVFHDVAIAIDEKGTEAAAATAVVFGEDGGEPESPEFSVKVDRTFYVAIRDRDARSLMFFARIGNPKAGA